MSHKRTIEDWFLAVVVVWFVVSGLALLTAGVVGAWQSVLNG